MKYDKMQYKEVDKIHIWVMGNKARICLGKIGFWFFVKAIKTWIFNTCLEVESKTVTLEEKPERIKEILNN